MRGVLVVASHFAPCAKSGVFRTLKFVKCLPRFGWKPVVLVVYPMRNRPRDASLLAEVPGGTVVKKVWGCGLSGLSSFCARLTGRPVLRSDWGSFFEAARVGRKLCERHSVDAIYLSAPPDRLPVLGLWLRRATGLPLVVDFRDPPWHLNHNWNAGHGEREAFERYSREVCGEAFRLIANTEPARRAMIERYGFPPEKVVFIPNGYDEEDFDGLSPGPRGPVLRALLAGALRAGGEVKAFAEGLARARSEPGFPEAFRMKVLGERSPRIEPELRDGAADGLLTFCGHRPHKEAVREMVASDLNVVFYPQAASALRVPQKLYPYLRAGRPILALMGDGPGRRIMEEFDAGISCDPLDAEAISDGLVRSFRRWREGGKAGPERRGIERFERARLTESLGEVLSAAVESER